MNCKVLIVTSIWVIGSCLSEAALGTKKLHLQWNGRISRDVEAVPPIEVKFDENDHDVILLNKINILDIPDRQTEPCVFMGRLQGEVDSVVSVSGCPEEANYEVFLVSKARGTYKLHVTPKLGRVEEIMFGDQRMTSVDKHFKSLMADKKTQEHSDIPATYYTRMAIGIDSKLFKQFGNKTMEYIERALVHFQVLFTRPDFEYKIIFDKPFPIWKGGMQLNTTSAGSAVGKSRKILKKILLETGNSHYYMHLIRCTSRCGVLGTAFFRTICKRHQVGASRAYSKPIYTAMIMAHEFGHGLGFRHNPTGCRRGVMGKYFGKKNWSNCTVRAFEQIVKKHKQFCLDRPAPVNGSGPSAWSAWSACSVNCGNGEETRTRYCVGYNCSKPFTKKQIRPCERQCEICKNKLSDEECKKVSCSNIEYAKENCSKKCHVNRRGWCKKYFKNERWCITVKSPYICAVACEVFCKKGSAMDGGPSLWSAWSECNYDANEQTRTRHCIEPIGSNGYNNCDPFEKTETRPCYDMCGEY